MELHKILWPDYENCIANLPNSILQHFGIPSAGKTLPLLDRYLEKDYKNIVVILLDGLGINILEKNLDPYGFFQSHFAGKISSVFPPTTVAATTSALSGLPPCAHAWIGWNCYYPQVDKNVTVFTNKEQGTNTPAADYNIAQRYTGYKSALDRLEEAGLKAYAVTPFHKPHPNSFKRICRQIVRLCRQNEKKYIYAYWNEPDHVMHMTGCFSKESQRVLEDLQKRVKKLCRKLKDTLVIVTADHGHIDSKGVCIADYPTIMNCLARMPSIEPRALNFFVKAGKEKRFETEFTRFFGKDFVLMTKQEVLEKKLFGTESEHPCFQSMLGNYLAVAVGSLTLFNTREKAIKFIGVHAGLTADEMHIPLIVIPPQEKTKQTIKDKTGKLLEDFHN